MNLEKCPLYKNCPYKQSDDVCFLDYDNCNFYEDKLTEEIVDGLEKITKERK